MLLPLAASSQHPHSLMHCTSMPIPLSLACPTLMQLLQQVRQLVAAAGFEVQSLKRVRIGGLRIPTTLGLGSYK